MKTTFKIGDRIKRVVDSCEEVSVGGIYTVERTKGADVYLQGLRLPYYSGYFVKVAGAAAQSLPTDSEARKNIPLAEGLLYYFPAALQAVAALSKKGNDQHNPGQPMHWARSKSSDHADCLMRHLMDSGTVDTDGIRHSAKVAWRALALLQMELEAEEGAPAPRNAR